LKKVALLLDDAQNQYQQLLVREAQAAAAQYGIELLPAEFAGRSSWTQLESIQSHLRQPVKPDGALVMLAGEQTMSSALARVVKAGIAVVFLNRIPPWVDDLRAAHPQALIAGVAPRQDGIGEAQAQHALRLARAGGLVVLITGESMTQTAVDRQRGFLGTVGSRFDVHVVDGRWSAEGAAAALADWFRMGVKRDAPIELVVCQNDAMAAGAFRALAKEAASSGRKELARVPLVGCDGLEQEGLAMVARGELAATLVLPPTTPAALKIMRRYWDTGATTRTLLLEGTSVQGRTARR
jgi:ABC-type sugar transport system substrate-binding protein